MSKINWKPGNMLYPLPVVMVSCAEKDSKPNIITVAWAGTVCSDPVMVSISVRKERYSHDIIERSREYVINLVTEDLAYATDFCGVRSGRDVDKFEKMRLTPVDIEGVSVPAIAESPLSLACKVVEVKELGSHDMFIAEVVNVMVDDRYMKKSGKFELNDSRLVTYSHGVYYGLGKRIGKFGYSVKKK